MALFKRRATPPGDLALMLMQGHDMIQRTGEAHRERWRLGDGMRWDADLSVGVIRWTFPDRVAQAPVQAIGSYSTTGATWLWAWANSSLPAGVTAASRRIREWGEAHGHSVLSTPRLDVSPEQAADLAAIGFRLMGATGYYRGPGSTSDLHMTFGPVTVTDRDGRQETFTLEVAD